MKWRGLMRDYDVPPEFHALLAASEAGEPILSADMIQFYGWLRNAERRAISKEKRNLKRSVLGISTTPACARARRTEVQIPTLSAIIPTP